MSHEELKSKLREISKKVDPAIKDLLTKYVEKEHHPLITYQVSTGGKRIRPGLAFISCKAIGGEEEEVLCPAAALEILHNCTLIIDDIIDNSPLRRKKPTMWKRFGPSIAQCMALDYAVSIFQAAAESKNPKELSRVFARTMKVIMDGEILDILFEQAGRENEPYLVQNRYREITDEDHLKMVSQKTAFLLQTSCYVGGVCGEGSEKEIAALKRFGFNLGMAFQVRDDVLDIFGEVEKFGKVIGKDIEERKLGNIVILYALKEMKEDEGGRLLEVLRKDKVEEEDVSRVVALIEETEARERAMNKGGEYIDRAKESLGVIPDNEWSRLLGEIADFILEREK